jgi:hypothetical protein
MLVPHMAGFCAQLYDQAKGHRQCALRTAGGLPLTLHMIIAGWACATS